MGRPRTEASSEAGQATPEYVAAVLLLAALFMSLLALVGPSLPGGALARAVAAKLVCAVDGGDACGASGRDGLAPPSPLERAYGRQLAAMIKQQVPEVSFEDGDFVSLPVDYRRCRLRSCADSIRHGSLSRTQTGLRPVAFVHVVDCRNAAAAARRGYDCSGARAGNVYLQFWLYYPDSRTGPASSLTGGYHLDDWESFQVRVDSEGAALARASSHRSYNGRSGGLGSVPSDVGWEPRSGWDTILGQLHVAAGSHAGTTQADADDTRRIPREALRLIPLEPIAAAGDAPSFAVSPPWEKAVWRDPEATGT